MSTEIALLRALLLFSRRKASPAATLADLIAQLGEEATDLELAIASLERAGLVQRGATPGSAPRLSLSGLAVAVAAAANARRAKTVARPKNARTARIIPLRLARRGRAA